MNRFECIGRLSRNVEIKTLSNGTVIGRFGIAVNRKYQDEQGNKIVDFFNCSVFGNLATNIKKFCAKGSKVYLDGELQNRAWEDENGVTNNITEIKVNNCEFLDNKSSDGQTKVTPTLTEIDNTDLPF